MESPSGIFVRLAFGGFGQMSNHALANKLTLPCYQRRGFSSPLVTLLHMAEDDSVRQELYSHYRHRAPAVL